MKNRAEIGPSLTNPIFNYLLTIDNPRMNPQLSIYRLDGMEERNLPSLYELIYLRRLFRSVDNDNQC